MDLWIFVMLCLHNFVAFVATDTVMHLPTTNAELSDVFQTMSRHKQFDWKQRYLRILPFLELQCVTSNILFSYSFYS